MTNYLKPIIFSSLLVVAVSANAVGVSPVYFCKSNIQVDVEQDDDGAYYLKPWVTGPTKAVQHPVTFKTIKKQGRNGLEIESGDLEQVRDGHSKHKALGQLTRYKFFFNKVANFVELKNAKGTKVICTDRPND